MSGGFSRVSSALVVFGATVGLPVLGWRLAGRSLGELLRFPPPLENPENYLRFSWLAAGAVMGALAALTAAWVVGARRRSRTEAAWRIEERGTSDPARFPVWGWLALVWLGVWWLLAWSRIEAAAALQRFTFFPLWLGFVVAVNALVQARTGSCLARRAPRTWCLLFAVSGGFWWMFEWLNRFVRNWHYFAVEDFGAAGYALNATLCFSTVLPAVAAVADWLESFPRWSARARSGPAWAWLERPVAGWAFVALGAAALLGTGLYPSGFYPALWSAPLALALGRQILSGRGSVACEIARGDWSRALSWMTAALVCGFFWELWNWRSLAKWIYTVPGVDRWRVFEMPLLGYSGYLPFGLECLLVVEMLGLGSEVAVARRVPAAR